MLLLCARRPESALSPFCLVEDLNLFPFDPLVLCHYVLGNPLARLDLIWFGRKVDQYSHEFAAVIRINSTGGIEHRNPMLDGKTAPGTHLKLVSGRKRNIEARVDKYPFKRLEDNWRFSNSR